MKIFHENFLLQSKVAETLYHDFAKAMPIIDYHNHLSPKTIAEDAVFENISEVWLAGDHYKWRAMRALGVSENLISGNASAEEKFVAWAKTLPKTLRNPLFHWSNMELQNIFEIDEYLNEHNAKAIFDHCNQVINRKKVSPTFIFNHFKVEMCGTTDDPCDNLEFHQTIKKNKHKTAILPSFRPDNVLNIDQENTFFDYINKLETASNQAITSFETLIEALKNRVDFFHDNGCRIADHGLATMPTEHELNADLNRELTLFLQKKQQQPFSNPTAFKGAVLHELCKMYHDKDWVQQFHLGAIRNNNKRLIQLLGADVGADSIGDLPLAQGISSFLGSLDYKNKLTKTILYNLNPADNEMFATMAGNFNDGETRGKIQFGSGWWFLDQKDGMEKQLNALSNMGMVSTFIGMTTDSRSFLSYPRHEYFRRTLCNLFAEDIKQGLIPNDMPWIGGIIKDISYFNAKKYFNF